MEDHQQMAIKEYKTQANLQEGLDKFKTEKMVSLR